MPRQWRCIHGHLCGLRVARMSRYNTTFLQAIMFGVAVILLLIHLDARANVFDTQFSQTPATVPLETVVKPDSLAGQQLTKEAAGAAWCAQATDGLLDTADEFSQYENFNCFWYDANTIRLEYKLTTYWPNGQVREEILGGRGTKVTTQITEVKQCPPEDSQFNTYNYEKEINGNLACFNLDDILTRDSCPDSSNDGAFVLPQLNNTASSICHAKDDGSLCAYDLSEGVYVANVENNRSCYTEQNPDTYDDAGLDPQEDNNQCHDIGNGVLACPEDPNNVCNSATGCQSGCGTVAVNGSEPVFMCLTDDTDGDGVGDYADPDIDGDGIPNEQDLDNDGDGIDDPVYDNGANSGGGTGSSSGQIINIDLTQTNNLLGQSNNLLGQIKSGVDGLNSNLDSGLDSVKNSVDGLANKLDSKLDNITNELQADFTEREGGRSCNALCDIFAEEDLNQIQSQIATATNEFNTLINSVKQEASSFFKFDVSNTAFENYSFDFGWTNKSFSLEDFREYFDLMGIIVLIIAGLTSIKVVLS